MNNPYSYAGPSPFPPSFEGNPFSYGFGLFGDVVAAAIALAMLMGYTYEYTRHRRAGVKLRNALMTEQPNNAPPYSALWLYRIGKMAILLFVVMRTLPDSAWMLAWGEVSEETIRAMLATDLLMDGLSVLPLLAAAWAWSWGAEMIPQLLLADVKAGIRKLPPRKTMLKSARIVLAVFLISVGVTAGKVMSDRPDHVITFDEHGFSDE